MTEFEGQGKSVEKAIEDALFNLKAPREDVDIKIIDEGGLFKKARVLVSISPDCISKYETKKLEKTKITEEEISFDVKSLLTETKEEIINENTTEENIELTKQNNIDLLNIEENVESDGGKFVKGLYQKLGIEVKLQESENDDKIELNMFSNNSAEIIGYRGDNLNAVQYLANVVNSKNKENNKKLILNIGEFRQKREESLINLAKRIARKVAKTNRSAKLEPMNANERRIIHTALQDDTYVTTFSKGTEPHRYLVITPKERN